VFHEHAHTLTRPEDYVNHSLYFEAKTFLHGLLVVEDKLSMAHGLETRVPFLDNDLVDFALRLPVGLKLGNLAEVVRLNENESGRKAERYYERTKDGKLLLRRVLSAYIPESAAWQPKQGFSAPDASWFRGDSIRYVQKTLLEGTAPIFEYLDGGKIKSLVAEHIKGITNRRLLIWSLISFNEWCKRFL
jgi:asparagine synthase (glutamine-hydrolysing)